MSHYCRSISILIIIAASLLQACNSDSESSSDKIIEESDVHIRLAAEPSQLNPALVWDAYSLRVLGHIFPRMRSYDLEDLSFSPALVRSSPKIDLIEEGPYKGGMSMQYEIRAEAKWDDGRDVLGKDYAFTIKTIFNPAVPAAPYRGYLGFIKDIRLDEKNPKLFTIWSDQRYILSEEASAFYILPEHLYDPSGIMSQYNLEQLAAMKSADKKLKAFANALTSLDMISSPEKIQGCGPYRLKEWQRGQKIVLERKENWWGASDKEDPIYDNPKYLTYHFVKDPAAAVTKLKDGSLEVMASIPYDNFMEMKDNALINKNFALHSPENLSYQYIALNTKSAQLKNKSVRRALAHLMDVPSLIKNVSFDLGTAVTGPVHPSKSYYNESLSPISYSIDEARQLLKLAGWTDSDGDGLLDKNIDGVQHKMNLDMLIPQGGKTQEAAALLLKESAKKVGIEINVITKAFASMREDMKARKFDLFALAAVQDMAPDDFMQFWHTSSDTPGGSNRCGFGDESSDKIIEQIRVSFDPVKRAELYKQFQEILYDEQPFIFLFSPLERIAIHKKFDNANASVIRPGFLPSAFVEMDWLD